MKYFFIISTLIFLTGCSTTSSYFDTRNVSDESDASSEYQYAAPWNHELYQSFFDQADVHDSDTDIKGGIVPHHLIAGNYTASFFASIASQKPSTIVLIGPNHFDRGYANIISTTQNWKSTEGDVKTFVPLIKTLADETLLGVEEDVIKEEHAVYSIIPFIAHYVPRARVVPLIIKQETSRDEMDMLMAKLYDVLPDDAVIVSSIDFSHYQPAHVADFHDALSMAVIRSFDFDRIDALEIDSQPSLYMQMKIMEHYGTKKIAYEDHSNSAYITHAVDEMQTTSHYLPYFVAGEKDSSRTMSMMHVGDIMIDRNVKKQIDTHGTDYILGELAGEEGRFFYGMDEIGANLEGPFADYRRDTTKSIAFRFDPVLIPMLQTYNFSIFNLANNHTLDMSRQGFAESQQHLKDGGFDFYGDQFSLTDYSTITKEIGGMSFAFVGINDTHNSIAIEDMVALVASLEATHDHTIVNIHWGAEYAELQSNARQQAIAHQLIDAGADAIIGHHPHVIQEMEIYNNRPIFYSLGNFIFDQYFSVPTQQTLAVGTVFHDLDSVTLYIMPIEAVQSQNKLMTYRNASSLMNRFIAASRLGDYTIDNFSVTIDLK